MVAFIIATARRMAPKYDCDKDYDRGCYVTDVRVGQSQKHQSQDGAEDEEQRELVCQTVQEELEGRLRLRGRDDVGAVCEQPLVCIRLGQPLA